MKKSRLHIYTDGSCLDNPGPGGWAAIMCYGEDEKEITGSETETTNNRMELMAAIMALESLKYPTSGTVTSDSAYLQGGITQWIDKWRLNGWKNASKKPVANQDLWLRLDALNKKHDITWDWVKGHSGHPMNERCDTLARKAAEDVREPKMSLPNLWNNNV